MTAPSEIAPSIVEGVNAILQKFHANDTDGAKHLVDDLFAKEPTLTLSIFQDTLRKHHHGDDAAGILDSLIAQKQGSSVFVIFRKGPTHRAQIVKGKLDELSAKCVRVNPSPSKVRTTPPRSPPPQPASDVDFINPPSDPDSTAKHSSLIKAFLPALSQEEVLAIVSLCAEDPVTHPNPEVECRELVVFKSIIQGLQEEFPRTKVERIRGMTEALDSSRSYALVKEQLEWAEGKAKPTGLQKNPQVQDEVVGGLAKEFPAQPVGFIRGLLIVWENNIEKVRSYL
eukprot:PhF_6_TR42138/c0_g1_i2/m.63650